MISIPLRTKIYGNISTDVPVVINGIFEGKLVGGPKIVVTGQAHVTGTLVADEIVIEGFVSADVYARKLVLSDTATVRGRIVHQELVLSREAYFEGQSRRLRNPAGCLRRNGRRSLARGC